MNENKLHQIVAASRVILFDFDGPLCSVFAGLSPPGIAASLIDVLRNHSATLDMWGFDAGDPLDVLRYSTQFGPSAVADIEDALIQAELRAIHSASPTPGGARAIRCCVASGRLAAVVSNNSTPAVVEYLTRRKLIDLVHPVVGRLYGAPHRMKPNADPVERALAALSVPPSAAALVGDSPSDIAAAQVAEIACIGFANKPPKWQRLASADVIIEDMAVLAAEFESTPIGPPARRT